MTLELLPLSGGVVPLVGFTREVELSPALPKSVARRDGLSTFPGDGTRLPDAECSPIERDCCVDSEHVCPELNQYLCQSGKR